MGCSTVRAAKSYGRLSKNISELWDALWEAESYGMLFEKLKVMGCSLRSWKLWNALWEAESYGMLSKKKEKVQLPRSWARFFPWYFPLRVWIIYYKFSSWNNPNCWRWVKWPFWTDATIEKMPRLSTCSPAAVTKKHGAKKLNF